MKKLFFYFTFFALINSSCNFCKTDNNPVEVKGHVVDYYTSKPIDNYYLNIAYPYSIPFGSRDVPVSNMKTDSNGYFHFSFKSESCRNYYIEGAYFKDIKYTSIDRTNLNINNKNDLVFKVKSLKILKLEFDIVSNIKHTLYYSDSIYFSKPRDTIVYLKFAVPDENYDITLWHYCQDGAECTDLDKKIYIENKDTTYFKLVY
jgi:hypothetical protein